MKYAGNLIPTAAIAGLLAIFAVPNASASPATSSPVQAGVGAAAFCDGKDGAELVGKHRMYDSSATGIPPRVYQHRYYRSKVANCNEGKSIKVRIDIQAGPDTKCKTIRAKKTYTFDYKITWFDSTQPEPMPRSIASC